MATTTQIKSKPLVSILMLTYNRAHYIEEAIAGVVNQTYQNWELIIIDDGSTDNTASVVQKFQEPRIRYIKHTENAGLHARRHESLTYIKGKYIAVLDSDDYWTSADKLEKQVEFLESEPECVVVGTFATLIDSTGEKIGQSKFATADRQIRNHILLRNQFVHSAVMFRTEAVEKTGGYQPILAEDMELILQLGKHGTLANIPQYFTAHRVHKKSANDHGKNMLNAVRSIIYKHRNNYPYARIAMLLNRIKLIRAKFL